MQKATKKAGWIIGLITLLASLAGNIIQARTGLPAEVTTPVIQGALCEAADCDGTRAAEEAARKEAEEKAFFEALEAKKRSALEASKTN